MERNNSSNNQIKLKANRFVNQSDFPIHDQIMRDHVDNMFNDPSIDRCIKKRLAKAFMNEMSIIEREEREKENAFMAAMKLKECDKFNDAYKIPPDVWKYILSFIRFNRIEFCGYRTICRQFNKFANELAIEQMDGLTFKKKTWDNNLCRNVNVETKIIGNEESYKYKKITGFTEVPIHFHYFRKTRNKRFCWLCGKSGAFGLETTWSGKVISKRRIHCRKCIMKHNCAISAIKKTKKLSMGKYELRRALNKTCYISAGSSNYYSMKIIDEMINKKKLY